MTTAPASRRWHAFHLFFGRPDHAERLILIAAREIELSGIPGPDWFFIRYFEGGPHIRVRICVPDSLDITPLRDALVRRCSELSDAEPGTSWAEAVSTVDADGKRYRPGTVTNTAYEPETIRYGGREALHDNEKLFVLSSAIALKVIADIPDRDPRRTAVVLDLMLSASAAMGMDHSDALEFFARYGEAWRLIWRIGVSEKRNSGTGRFDTRLRELLTYSTTGTAPASLAQHWLRSARTACLSFWEIARRGALIMPQTATVAVNEQEVRKAIESMIASQIHMLNNRLGIWPTAEILLSDRLCDGLTPRRN